MNYPHPLIAREGWPFIGITFVLVLVTSFTGIWSIPAWLLFLFCLQFFRDPPRFVAGNEKSIVSAADGRVVMIAETDDPYLKRRALKISVFMNVFNVHSNRAPVKSTIQEKWYFPGSFLNAILDKASLENERCALHLKTEDGQDVTCVQIAGLVARRILNYKETGEPLLSGQRFGFIRFGSRVDLYLPLGSEPKVVIGQKVSAASTVLAQLP